MKVLITGASSGIGRCMAKRFDELGYDLVLVARNKKALNDLKKELNGNVEVIVTDVGVYDNCVKLHKDVRDVDILVNNAGFGLFGEFFETSLEKEVNMIDVNIRALHVLTKLYLKDMMNKDKGTILNVASIAGFMPGPLLSTYYATKNYVLRLSQGIKEELRRKKSNVKVCVLCPGPVKTNFDKTAGVDFSLIGLEPDYVARYTIDKMMRGKFIIVPGMSIKILRFFSKFIPDWLIVRCVYMAQQKKGR